MGSFKCWSQALLGFQVNINCLVLQSREGIYPHPFCKDANFSHSPQIERVNQKDLGRCDTERGKPSRNRKVSEKLLPSTQHRPWSAVSVARDEITSRCLALNHGSHSLRASTARCESAHGFPSACSSLSKLV